MAGWLNPLQSLQPGQKFAGKSRQDKKRLSDTDKPIADTFDRLDLARKITVPEIDRPIYKWTEANPDGTRLRKAIPNRLVQGERERRHGLQEKYYLVDPEASEALIMNTPEKLSPANVKKIQKICKQFELFKIPLANPLAHHQNVGDVRIPWLRKQYSGKELAGILKKPFNERDHHLITYFTSVGSAYKQVYSNFWWLRDSETVAYAFSHNQQSDAKKRKLEHRLGARITLTNLSHYVSRSHNIFTARAYADKGKISVLGAVRVLIDDEVREQIRAGKWDEHIIQIRERTVGGKLDEKWPQLQFDALGLHLAALSEHLGEKGCLKWKALTPQEKEAFTALYAYMLRLKYWDTPDSGAWEFDQDGRMIRSSSVAMATNGMRQLQKLLFSEKGQPIRQWMQAYLAENVVPLASAEKQQAVIQEVIEPLSSETAFEKAAVAPGFRRLYHQLPFEGLKGINPDELNNPQHLYRAYHPANNPGYWDSATLFIPRYAPELLKEMPRMKQAYFPKDQIPQGLRQIRSRYANKSQVVAFEKGFAENFDYNMQILESNRQQLWRRSGVIRYFNDAYQNLVQEPNVQGPFRGKAGQEPEWTNFSPAHAVFWFNRYVKSGKKSDFLRGLDAWNLSVSSLARFTDVRDGFVKVRWSESVRPQDSESLKIEKPLIPDLIWSHAEGKAMWEAFQLAYARYEKERLKK